MGIFVTSNFDYGISSFCVDGNNKIIKVNPDTADLTNFYG